MALFDGLLSGILNRRPQVQLSPVSGAPIFIGEKAAYPDANARAFIRDAFSGNGTIYTIISTAARKFGYIPRFVYKIENKSAQKSYNSLLKTYGRETKMKDVEKLFLKAYNEDIVDNDFSKLLSKPNDTQGQDAFYELALVFYLATGETFIWKNRGDIEGKDDAAIDKIKPLELLILPTDYVDVLPDPDDIYGVMGYHFRVGGVKKFIRKNDIIHWKRPNPNYDESTFTHLRGLSPLTPGNKLRTQDEAATDAMVAMHQNDGAKGALYNEDLKNLTPTQKSQLEGVIGRKINNRDIKGAVATLQGKWGYLDFGATAVDMQLDASQTSTFVRLCNLFGVNPMLFLANATYENISQARKDLITGLLLPCAASLRDEMNRSLLPDFGLNGSYTHDVDVSNLAELQEDMTLKVTQLQNAWWLTPNQKLEEMNQDRSDDPNMDKVWIPNNLTLMDDAALSDPLNSFNDSNPGNSGGDVPNL
jgi:HK97 family phage portal protein